MNSFALAARPHVNSQPDSQFTAALAKVSPEAKTKAKQTAEDFEAMFLNSMFSQMTSSVKGDGPFGDTTGTGVWRSMLTEQYADAGIRRHHGAAARQRIGLADLRAFGNRYGEIALRDRDSSDADVPAHDDDAGAFVDDDLRRHVRFDLQLLDLGQQRDDVALEFFRNGKLHS